MSRITGWSQTLRQSANMIILACLVIWAFKTALRVSFPYDLYCWSESTFLTNILKIEGHQPVFTNPADGNSFLYSPGLEYLCYGLLKPFGLELDIRASRMIVILLAVAGAAFGALVMTRFLKPELPLSKCKGFFLLGWAVLLLSISKNFLADSVHPDNLHAFHALLVFCLTFMAVEKKRFGLALVAVSVAGLGVFAKQTEAFSVLGVCAYFIISKCFSRARILALIIIGTTILTLSNYILWLPQYAHFYTLQMPARQEVHLLKVFRWGLFMVELHCGLLLVLGALAGWVFWQANGLARRYLLCWATMGFFCVMPCLAAYMKIEGTVNNLALFRTWLWMLVLPFFWKMLEEVRTNPNASLTIPWMNLRPKKMMLCAITVVSMVFFFPVKQVPQPGHYVYAGQLEKAVRTDVVKSKKVLVAQGASMLIRAGSKEIPMDQACSILELRVAKEDQLSQMSARIKSHYYDHIYLTMGEWYGTNLMAEIQRNYAVDYTIKTTVPEAKSCDDGFQGGLMSDCLVLSARE